MTNLNFGARIGRWTIGSALAMLLLSACGGGSSPPEPPANAAPAVTMLLSGAVEAGGSTADATASAGAELVLSANGSTDPDGDAITYKWSIVSKPATSNMVLTNDTATQQTIKPDVGGVYVINLRVSDSKGAFTDKKATINIRANSAPVSNIVISATYTGVSATKPTQQLNVGAAIVFDATGSTDADGDVVTTTWTLIEKPAGSNAAMSTSGLTSRLVLDVKGVFKVRARGTDAHGAWSESIYVIDANNVAPVTMVLTSVTAAPGGGAATLAAATGYMVAFNGSGSTDPDGSALTYAWTITSKPAGSTAALSSSSGVTSQIIPDVLGNYVVKMTATDSAGASSSFVTTIEVKNRRPIAAISSNATPVALPSGPAIRLPLNTVVTLRGTSSVDADGDALVYSWSMTSKPAGSVAVLSSASGSSVQITPEKNGSYIVLLRVTDAAGAFSEQSLSIEVGNYAPVAVTDKNRITILTGVATTASAALSYDEDGEALTYQWTIDAHPLGSVATIAAPSSPTLSFTPDLVGTYVAAVTVSDGKNSSVAYVNIRVLASLAGRVALNFAPLEARYSKGLDKVVVVASNPNALKIVDPFTAAIKTVLLPLGVKSLQLSPNGKLAAVLHEGVVSLVDLDAATLIRSTPTGGSQTDAFASNAGLIYMIGQTGGQWVDPSVTAVDGYSGVNMNSLIGLAYGQATFYGTQYGVFASKKNKVFFMSQGLSPSDISYFGISPNDGKVTVSGDSPYHGDYGMSTPLFLSDNEDLLFTSFGTFFHTDTLRYAGKLTLTSGTGMLSMSHSSDIDEALVLEAAYSYYNSERTYSASYQRFVGALFLPDTAISLPVIDSAQSYGLKIFHSANGNHVAIVQTGSATQNAAAVKYYVTTR
ncbi:PKD domain-containing protein [Massilia glaciei]|nr:PKD domain-containing protein [Massilia glaciei]